MFPNLLVLILLLVAGATAFQADALRLPEPVWMFLFGIALLFACARRAQASRPPRRAAQLGQERPPVSNVSFLCRSTASAIERQCEFSFCRIGSPMHQIEGTESERFHFLKAPRRSSRSARRFSRS